VLYGLYLRATSLVNWPLFTGQAWPLFTGHPGLYLRAGILFFAGSLRGTSIVSKPRAVPFEIVLCRQQQGVAVTAARCFQFSQPPMRGLAFAVHAETSGVGHDDEAVILKLTEPAADTVAVSANFRLRISLR
jgi:hypothetical protein